jgi:hypothetical protein
VLAWADPAWRLEESETVTGPWRPVATAGTTTATAVVVAPALPRFYRLHLAFP